MPRVEDVAFWRGKSNTTPADRVSGRLLFTEDTGEVFVEYRDYDSGEIVRQKLTDTSKFNISGGIFQGPVILYRNPEDPLEAATRDYVDILRTQFAEHRDDDSRHLDTEKIFSVGNDNITGEREYWNQKVNSIEGKGLSENDFTDEYKQKLDSITDNADKVTFEQDQNEGYLLGTLVINDVRYDIYSPRIDNISGTADSAKELATTRYLEGMPFNGTQNVTHFATCSTSATIPNKYVQLSSFNQSVGSRILVDFLSSDNSPENSTITLRVNNGANIPITYMGEAIPPKILKSGIHEFIFSSNEFKLVHGVDTTYGRASDSSDGLMTSEQKIKLDQAIAKLETISEGANNYTLPIANDTNLGGVIIGSNISVDNTGRISINDKNITDALGYVPFGGTLDPEQIVGMIGVFEGCSDTSQGSPGLVPAPDAGEQQKVLLGNGTWGDLHPFQGATETSDGTSGLVPMPCVGENEDGTISNDNEKFLKGDGTWSSIDASDIIKFVTMEEFKEYVGI